MIPLDDPGWASARHAYGAATDVPDLLQALSLSPGPAACSTDEPWFSLWSRLCHQGDVFTASYLAVPHIVRIACAAAGPVDTSFFLLPASVEVARRGGHGPEMPPAAAPAYHAAIAGIMDAVSLHRDEGWSRDMLLSAAAAQAVAKGHVEVAEAMMSLDDDWIARINEDDRE